MNVVKGCWVMVVLASSASALAEDKVAAESAFRAAKELEKAGKLAEACPLYEASYRADPQLGALLNLANCHELTGRTATAWVELRDATELATRRGDPRVEYTRKRLAALEPRLMKLRIEAPPGVTVERNGTDVTALVRQPLAVDPGTYRVRASAAGKLAWETSVAVEREGETVEVAVPELAPIASPPPASVPSPPPPVPAPAGTPVSRPRVAAPATAPPRPRARSLALAVGGVGVASAVVGLGFGVHARSQWQASRDPASCDVHNVCSPTGAAQVASARSSAAIATWAVGAGAALTVTAAVIWWTAPSERRRQVSVVPGVARDGASVSVFARF